MANLLLINISFHFRLLPRKIIKFFKKNKKLFQGHFGSYLVNFGQK